LFFKKIPEILTRRACHLQIIGRYKKVQPSAAAIAFLVWRVHARFVRYAGVWQLASRLPQSLVNKKLRNA
jgi:hypothetical protein